MMKYISSLIIFVALASFIALCHAQSCDPSVQAPLSIPIRNVSLQAPAVRRGAAVSIGTPPQTFAFQINPQVNNTVLYDQSGACDASTPPIQCLGENGGAFDESASRTWQDASSLPVPGDAANNSYGYDTIIFDSLVNLSSFPIDIARSHSFDMNALGLGTRSTILDGLSNAGVIASRSFSMFFGLTGAEEEHQMDGNLVLGGYDEAKFTGQNFTSDLTPTPGCTSGLLTIVSDIHMGFPNGTSQSIIGPASGSALKMCIQPEYELITVPSTIWDLFQQYAPGSYIGRSYGINLWGEVYAADNVYAGDLTFTFSNDLQITIPNHQLVIPDISVDITGNTVFNSSTREVMLNSLQPPNANDMPLLGMTFLTSAYLSVNHDRGTFSLWQANATTDEKLVGIGRDSNGCLGAQTNRTSATPGPSPSPSASPKPTPTHVANSTIAAIVVGVLAFFAVIAGCLYMRRKTKRDRARRNAVMAQEYRMEPPTAVKHELGTGKTWYPKAELAADAYGEGYTDSDSRSVPGRRSPTRDPYEHHYRGSSTTPHELDGS